MFPLFSSVVGILCLSHLALAKQIQFSAEGPLFTAAAGQISSRDPKTYGIRHPVRQLPRLRYRDLHNSSNTRYAYGLDPFILIDAVSNPDALTEWAASPRELSRMFGDRVTEFYPLGMPENVNPYLLTFSDSVDEVIEVAEADVAASSLDAKARRKQRYRKIHNPRFPLPTSVRGGRYAHLNLISSDWQKLVDRVFQVDGDGGGKDNKEKGSAASGSGGSLTKKVSPFLRVPLFSSDSWLKEAFPEDQVRDAFLLGTHWRMLLLGGTGSGMFNHQDYLHTASWQVQLAGEKVWHICSPRESHRLSVLMDAFAPDYTEFPDALMLEECYLDVLKPGELIYYPHAYWHQTLNIGAPLLSVAVTDTVADWNNHRLVQGGLLQKCDTPTQLPRAGLVQPVCDSLPRLFAWWDLAYGICRGGAEETCKIPRKAGSLSGSRSLPAAPEVDEPIQLHAHPE